MIMSESKKYIIKNEYETAYLVDKASKKIISAVADMYGDPIGAAISPDEKYCVIYGCGAVVYYIKKPFQNYEYGCISEQWFEVSVDGSVWFDSVGYYDTHKVILLSEEHFEYTIDIESKSLIRGTI